LKKITNYQVGDSLEEHLVDEQMRRKGWDMPHVFVTFFILLMGTALLSHILPAGTFDRALGPTGSKMLVNGSYHAVSTKGTSLFDIFRSIPRGITESASIIALTLIIGGSFAVIRSSGLIEVALAKLAQRLNGRGLLVVPVLMLVFSTIDTFIGTPELCLIYIPIVMPLILALGFDSLTAVMVVMLGSCSGFTSSLTNPFLVGISQKIAGVPLYSGLGFRVICFVLTTAVSMWFVMRHASKVRRDPQSSPVHILDKGRAILVDVKENPKAFTSAQKIVGISVTALFAMMIFGIVHLGWDLDEMSGIFLAMIVVTWIATRVRANKLCETFLQGAQEVLLGALVIGLARAVPVLMQQSQILDTVVFHLAGALKSLPASAAATGVIVVTAIFNIFISSGSGKAAVLMPILAPLAQLLHISPNILILGYQYGDGMTMFFWPTSGFFMAALMVSGVSWTVWAQATWRIFLMFGILGSLLTIAATSYGY
jgi:uncharacterized ion transporter superfamily protein YfcC